MEPWGRPSLKVLEGRVEPFSRTLAVRFMNQEDRHSVKQRSLQSSTSSSVVTYSRQDHTPD